MLKSIARKTDLTGLNGSFEVEFPLGVRLNFMGAPFRQAAIMDERFDDLLIVKCATEQLGGADISIPCQDFGVPKEKDMLAAVNDTIEAAFEGQPVFAGCAGGIGRTGTFLSVVLKALQSDLSGNQPVAEIRRLYLGHAVETEEQKRLVREIDVSFIRRRVKWLWVKAVLRRFFGAR